MVALANFGLRLGSMPPGAPRTVVAALVAAWPVAVAAGGGAGGTTTVIAHGYSPDGKGAWVESLATAALARAGGEGAVYRYTGATGTWARVAGDGGNGSGQNVVLIFNWEVDSGSVAEGPNWRYVQAAGDVLHAVLRAPSYAAGSAGPADLLGGRRVHLIGHSRGASVASEAIRRLALARIPVDQMTTLDPHPVNGTLDSPYNYDWGDPVPERWANVAWADNYWRADGGGLINGLDFDGMPLANVLNVQLSESTLNCCGYSISHSDVHLWYHGTADLGAAASDGDEPITSQMRSSWWPQGAALVGFARSAIGGSERPAIPPGIEPSAASAPLLMNGGFESGSRAGWAEHGGSGATLGSASGNWFARLSAARPRLVHNRAYLPSPPTPGRALTLSFMVRRSGTAGSGDVLRASIERPGDAAPIAIAAASWPVAAMGTAFVPVTVQVPPELTGVTALLHLHVEGGADGGIASTVEIDDLVLALAAPAADLDGNGRVDGQDLGTLLSSWGACGICAADLDRNGIVDGADLARLLADWG